MSSNTIPRHGGLTPLGSWKKAVAFHRAASHLSGSMNVWKNTSMRQVCQKPFWEGSALEVPLYRPMCNWVDADPRTAVSSFRSILTVQEGEGRRRTTLGRGEPATGLHTCVILFIALPLSDDKPVPG